MSGISRRPGTRGCGHSHCQKAGQGQPVAVRFILRRAPSRRFHGRRQGGVDIVFADEDEVMALFEVPTFEGVLAAIEGMPNLFVMTRSEQGSVVVHGDEKHVQDRDTVEPSSTRPARAMPTPRPSCSGSRRAIARRNAPASAPGAPRRSSSRSVAGLSRAFSTTTRQRPSGHAHEARAAVCQPSRAAGLCTSGKPRMLTTSARHLPRQRRRHADAAATPRSVRPAVRQRFRPIPDVAEGNAGGPVRGNCSRSTDSMPCLSVTRTAIISRRR